MPTFQTPQPITLSIELDAGTIRIAADAVDTSQIELSPSGQHADEAQALIAETQIDHHGDRISVHVPSGRSHGLLRRSPEIVLDARIPAGSSLTVRTKSADVVVTGELGETRVATGSGDVQLGDVDGNVVVESGSGDVRIGTIAGEANVRTASGDVVVVTCCGGAKIHTASGDIMIDTAEGDLEARSASGDIVVREADAEVNCRTASGDVRLERVRGEELVVVSASGDVQIGVQRGIAVWLDVSSLSGDVSSALEAAEQAIAGLPTLQLRASSTSGDISIRSV